MSAELEAVLKSLFDKADTNKDGKISVKDLSGIGTVDDKTKANLDSFFAALDTDKDGEVTFDEFKVKYGLVKK
ncbi:EF-hand domain-containing protein [Pseudomonas mosselii]|uniref:EF-hand domain-containing protein n=1 Tax=Pseudomonas mosselii TaxID=78327 RepID=UPI000D943CDB|nr:EF-hand domain-containing protein [Pseudomonas mosselii]PYC11393.1 hypothetical protein DMX06_25560 [Pseudomonas mosselii]